MNKFKRLLVNYYLQENSALEENPASPIIPQSTVDHAIQMSKKFVFITKTFHDEFTSSITWFHSPTERFSSEAQIDVVEQNGNGFFSPELGKLCEKFSEM